MLSIYRTHWRTWLGVALLVPGGLLMGYPSLYGLAKRQVFAWGATPEQAVVLAPLAMTSILAGWLLLRRPRG